MEGALLAYAQEVLGGCSPVDRQERPGGSHLLEVVDDDGGRWFVKHSERFGPWRAEVRAYRHWVPALGDRAPRMRAAERRRQMLVLSGVPGDRAAAHDPDAHRQAGTVLRRFHASRPARPAADEHAQMWSRRLEGWFEEVAGALTRSEWTFVRRQTRRLRNLGEQWLVPCHGDYRPYNWLVDDDRVLRVIDFGGAQLQVWAWDLARLFLGPWWDNPELAAVFLDGYGHALTDDDELLIDLHGATQAAIQIAWGRKHGRASVEDDGRERLRQLMGGRSVVAAAG